MAKLTNFSEEISPNAVNFILKNLYFAQLYYYYYVSIKNYIIEQ